MILLFRCLYLAETTPGKILVLCYNITLASYLRECIEARGLASRVTVSHFHSWCASMVKRHGIKVTADRKEYPDKCFSALEEAVNSGKSPEPDMMLYWWMRGMILTVAGWP